MLKKSTKYAIVRATYSLGKSTGDGWISTLIRIDPVEWGDFDESVFFDDEKEAILLSKQIEALDFPGAFSYSVIALTFFDTTED